MAILCLSENKSIKQRNKDDSIQNETTNSNVYMFFLETINCFFCTLKHFSYIHVHAICSNMYEPFGNLMEIFIHILYL